MFELWKAEYGIVLVMSGLYLLAIFSPVIVALILRECERRKR